MAVYAVLNIDIVGSRAISDRAKFQDVLKAHLETLSCTYSTSLVAPITLTLGDEWQIVVRDLGQVYNLYLEVKTFLKTWQQDCYCGIGIGQMSTKEAGDTRQMDGEVFILARESLTILKSNKRSYRKLIPTKECRVFVRASSSCRLPIPSLDLILNNILQNNETLLARVTPKQAEVIKLYESLGTYSEITKAYPHLSKGMISERLKASNYWLIKSNEQLIQDLIKAYTLDVEEV